MEEEARKEGRRKKEKEEEDEEDVGREREREETYKRERSWLEKLQPIHRSNDWIEE